MHASTGVASIATAAASASESALGCERSCCLTTFPCGLPLPQLCTYFIPETRGKSLEELGEDLDESQAPQEPPLKDLEVAEAKA